MKSVVVVSSRSLDLSELAETYDRFGKVTRSPDGLSVGTREGWFNLLPDNRIANDYGPLEMNRICRAIPTPNFASLGFRTLEDANTAVSNLPTNLTIWIDNDHGLFEPLDEIKKKIKTGLDWHFLRTTPVAYRFGRLIARVISAMKT